MAKKAVKQVEPQVPVKTFGEEVAALVGDEYTPLGIYVSEKVKIKMKHNTCGHEFSIKPVDFLKGKRCPNCS